MSYYSVLTMDELERIANMRTVGLGATKRTMRYPHPEKVIFNNPATIVFWGDGTKTVVKCHPDDTFSKYHGVMAALLKKMLGNTGRYNAVIKEMIEVSEDWQGGGSESSETSVHEAI